MDNKAPIKSNTKSRRLNVSEISGQLGKIPPQALELEEAVLGALMLEREALTTVIEILKPGCFYRAAHNLIYEAIVNLINYSEQVDFL